MPAFDNNETAETVIGNSMNSLRKIVDRPCLLVNKLNVRKKRIWHVPRPEANAVCSSEFVPFSSHSSDLSFIKISLLSERITAYLESCSSGSSNSQKRVTPEIIMSSEIIAPSLAEQRRIGAFFDRLDSLITLHQGKYDKLCVLKKSMLDKMFPKGGSLYPEIRFAGFTDPWEQRKLGELVEIERGGSPRPIEQYITDDPCGLNWVKIGDAPELGRYITKTAEKIKPEGLSKTRQVYPGDLVLSNSMSFGRPYIMAIKGCVHDGWLLIRDAQKHFDPIFLCHMLGAPQMLNQYRMFAAGSTVNNLNKELVGNAIVSLPSKNEQHEIGIALDRLDSLITLHQRKYCGVASWMLGVALVRLSSEK
ncbi:restriction endonuclease subunit S [Bifidobacterium faecale]|uniref:restriction endonuclease subunit S n=1 Tax=Bifidobacterium adolescentis TaxID=1680 RepID=UPI0016594FF8|nr:restriction endonuclease subunit S [Bifidobacterium faecale]